MVEAPESARDDNARRDRIALCGGAAMSAAHHQAYIEEYDTAQLEIVAVRLAQLAQCTCDDGRQPSRESGVISAACLCKCPTGSGASQTPADGPESSGRVVGWMWHSRRPHARAGMALGTHEGGCGRTEGARRLLEEKVDLARLVVAGRSRLSRQRSGDDHPPTDCTATDGRAVLVAVVVAFPCRPGPARWVGTSAHLRNLGCSAMQPEVRIWHAGGG